MSCDKLREDLWGFFDACGFSDKPYMGVYEWGDYESVVSDLKGRVEEVFEKAEKYDEFLEYFGFKDLADGDKQINAIMGQEAIKHRKLEAIKKLLEETEDKWISIGSFRKGLKEILEAGE